MPIYSCGDGKFRIGDGECMYTSRASAQRAYVAYLAQEEDGMEEPDKYKEETYNDYPFASGPQSWIDRLKAPGIIISPSASTIPNAEK